MQKFASLCAVCVLASAAMAQETTLPRGVVAEKPASGPAVEVEGGFMVPYTERVPGTEIDIEMIPVPGGEFTFGSSADDEARGEFELDEVKVKLPPFWIAKHELTWGAYWPYMKLNDDFAKLQEIKQKLTDKDASKAEAAKGVVAASPAIAAAIETQVEPVDGITAPTPLYDPGTTYEFGQEEKLPAATMTPYAAMQYSKWLSATTGTQYRLPTEAEWEYAARAGSKNVYPGGDDASNIGDFAWYTDNSDYSTHEVGALAPNAWGLYDMFGNVAEMVIDEYNEELERPEGKTLSWAEAVNWAKSNDMRICRGGFFDAEADACRVTSRFYTEEAVWKGSDPNAPLSPWWFADYPSSGVGMRLVRSYEPLDTETIAKFWNFDSPEIEADVKARLAGRRGKLGPADPNLPKAQKELASDAVKGLLGGGK
ncbi:formylglycine-generating enzyme family protein [Aeoliella sp. SH292]|uniref:formylglycine-generating enzyme family protein n=1 Tax=Aeoliella sp. SH292 TaxID=3454464 RepID=UPI003F9BC930